MAALLDEVMFRGDCRIIRLQVINELTNLPVGDLSGWTFTWTLKATHDDADVDAIAQLTLGDGIEVIDNAESIIEITIGPSATADVSFIGRTTRLYQDCQAVDTAGAPWTIAAGRLNLRADVTLVSSRAVMA